MSLAARAPGRADRFASLLVEGAGLLVAVPLWAWWAVWKGGYPAAVFLPGIVYLAVAGALLLAFAPRPRLSRPAAVALAALAALTLWTIASVIWADDTGAAEVMSGRAVLLLASFALPLLWPPTRRALEAGLMLLPAIALAGGISALVAVLGDAELLLDGRLVEPTGYVNATAALMAIGALPALMLASRREVAPRLRVAILTAAGPLLAIFVLTQSRGAVAALALTLLIVLALLPGRLRLLVPVAIAAVALATGLDPVLEVRTVAVEGGDLSGALWEAVWAIALIAVGLAMLTTAYVLLDARREIAPSTTRRLSRLVAGALAVAAVAAVALLALTGPSPASWFSERVEDFKTPDYSRLESERTRFTGELGSNRYDYWRVSAEIFADRPVAGTGAGNFIAPFLERRRADKATIYAHSIWLETLGQLGTVGFLALLSFLVALLMALVRASRRIETPRWLPVVAATPFAYLLLHGSADWVTVFPAVAAPAFALVGAAAGRDQAAPPRARRGVRSASLWLVLGLVVAALVALPLLVSARLADRGAATWAERPAGAIDDLELAADLDPLAAAPYVRLGIVAVDLGMPALERRAFESALRRDSSAWYPEFQLGLLAASRGDRGEALSRLRAAAERNPREAEISKARQAVRGGGAPDARAVQARILTAAEN